jgi:type IV secretory pathway TrbD component
MIYATYAMFVFALTYAMIATRHLVMWRFPESAAARWMEVQDPTLQALIVRHLGGRAIET